MNSLEQGYITHQQPKTKYNKLNNKIKEDDNKKIETKKTYIRRQMLSKICCKLLLECISFEGLLVNLNKTI